MALERVEYLNHAALRVDLGGVRLLSDPWLFGTAFSGGWGLRYANDQALDVAAEATHLWLSHWHSDHLHAPSLRALAERNPDMVVLANVSKNFSMIERLVDLGFNRVRALPERVPVDIGDGVWVNRFPTAGIDNMLVIRAGGKTLLNYNDCNLPERALRALCDEIGPIDLLFVNYNHAGKLFDDDDDRTRRDRLWQVLRDTADVVGAPQVFPFASNHYYRVEESAPQNGSLLSPDDLARRAAADPTDARRFVVLPVGGAAEVHDGRLVPTRTEPALENTYEVHDYGASVDWDELTRVVQRRCVSVGRHFLGTAHLIPELRVHLKDLGRTIGLRVGRRPREVHGEAHVVAHSVALADWLGRPFGDDTFVAGAHFGLASRDTLAIRTWALVTLLDASHLAPAHLLGYAAGRSGRRFLWNRKEEILATIVGARFRAGQVRL